MNLFPIKTWGAPFVFLQNCFGSAFILPKTQFIYPRITVTMLLWALLYNKSTNPSSHAFKIIKMNNNKNENMSVSLLEDHRAGACLPFH